MKYFITSVLIFFILVLGFGWLMYSASSHNIENSIHFFFSILILCLTVIIIKFTGYFPKLKEWIILVFVLYTLIFSYKYFQPLCEPCMSIDDCPKCMSYEQYCIKYLGFGILFIFLAYKLIKEFKNSASS